MKTSSVIVVGGGVGGLATAALLGRQGMAVTLVEQAPRFSDIGAGLQVSPNGLRVLRAMGLETPLRQRGAVEARAVVLQNGENGRTVARLDLAKAGPEGRYLFAHRAGLIEVLADAARRANVTFDLGRQVASVRPGALPQIQMTDGTIRRAEVVVAADGIHSVARPVLNGADTARFTGQVAWRATVADPGDHPPEVHVHMGAGRHLVSYPIKGGALINLVAVEERDRWAAEGWTHADDPAHLREAFAGFTGRAADLLSAVEKVTLWGLHSHPVAAQWQQGGVALLGDAAHPTLPFLAQGANMALEDAWVLADCLTRQERDTALRQYQARRADRVARVVQAAERNAWRYHLAPGPLRWGAHAALRIASRAAPGRMTGAFDWLYAHDVTRRG
ncbi:MULTISPECIES: FAD-dependent monooxygenase [unclassified Sulfitobacter]|uniref:FAD-dependent monooxygenase n=2 Tax=Sulfitobacter TaxID=60136 RepID=UPI0007C3DB8E|nr:MULTISPECIES: FAD-dependent monooxygenase [unclassified Sulfitobacter]KZY02653.1 monooxygenase [Sulfitobacter sp. HI0023]KZZ68602.1 monooxygenase [Sulfitobacter sp. HI0129]